MHSQLDQYVALINSSHSANINKQFADAESLSRKALEINPNSLEGWYNFALALIGQKKIKQAKQALEKGIGLSNQSADSQNSFGVELLRIGEYKKAINAFLGAIKTDSKYAFAHANLAIAYEELKDPSILPLAGQHYQKALELNSELSLCHINLARLYARTSNTRKQIEHLELAMTITPSDELLGQLIHARMMACDWSKLPKELKKVASADKVVNPFDLLSTGDDPEIELLRATNWARHLAPEHPRTRKINRSNPTRIRLAYLSCNFYEHPVGRLIANHIENHNKKRFEIFSYSFSYKTESKILKRIKKSSCHFFDLHNKPDQEVVKKINSANVDIVIDLMGYTHNSKSHLITRINAPIKINFLGYPGTMGMKGIDYIIGDEVLTPPKFQKFYSEKIIYMPNCYQPQENFTPPSQSNEAKKNKNFSILAINNTYKISPDCFESWMNILKKAPNSILTLLDNNELARNNLIKTAERMGIERNRLVFFKKTKYQDYLKMLSTADVFADTFNYNAGATASDALRAGLPVVTLQGKTYAARMASSILSAANLGELIASEPTEYENIILGLYNNPEILSKVRKKVSTETPHTTLWDSNRYTADFEAAIEIALARHSKNQPIDHIYVTKSKTQHTNPEMIPV
jgi:protein O-GlcNAc transferase